MSKALLPAAAALLLAGCGGNTEQPEPKPDPEEIANFLAERDTPGAAVVERQYDIEQSGLFLEKAPLERSEDVARELAER